MVEEVVLQVVVKEDGVVVVFCGYGDEVVLW